jgi:predicted nucleotide-binding protein
MLKGKSYKSTLFSAEVIKEGAEVFAGLRAKGKKSEKIERSYRMDISFEDESWTYDNADEFFADYRKHPHIAHFHLTIDGLGYCVKTIGIDTEISIAGSTRRNVQAVFEIFEKYADGSKFVDRRGAKNKNDKPTIFIGHGHSNQWKDLKDHLHEKHGYVIEAYETGSRAGLTIRDILENMLSNSSIAFLVMTAEDSMSDGTTHARRNVIHEAGLFQGRLGFNRAIVLIEEGTSEFSNIYGIQQIRFSKNNIKESFGEVLAVLKREYKLDKRKNIEH